MYVDVPRKRPRLPGRPRQVISASSEAPVSPQPAVLFQKWLAIIIGTAGSAQRKQRIVLRKAGEAAFSCGPEGENVLFFLPLI